MPVSTRLQKKRLEAMNRRSLRRYSRQSQITSDRFTDPLNLCSVIHELPSKTPRKKKSNKLKRAKIGDTPMAKVMESLSLETKSPTPHTKSNRSTMAGAKESKAKADDKSSAKKCVRTKKMKRTAERQITKEEDEDRHEDLRNEEKQEAKIGGSFAEADPSTNELKTRVFVKAVRPKPSNAGASTAATAPTALASPLRKASDKSDSGKPIGSATASAGFGFKFGSTSSGVLGGAASFKECQEPVSLSNGYVFGGVFVSSAASKESHKPDSAGFDCKFGSSSSGGFVSSAASKESHKPDSAGFDFKFGSSSGGFVSSAASKESHKPDSAGFDFKFGSSSGGFVSSQPPGKPQARFRWF
ncbi:expressed unknown protein [Seminavis robusta]|uniref:Uncharacterized protein n=1 Tax=Seminavis robusta TaxID=568900 RepID=A0A9N8HSW3_9STRA|nr:expressed unknown protein [Seminavis robusta]|eukprot:Sro1206_g252400.1 n/a (357) ;mRNA; r:28501-29686